jgi:hypothetical protein
MAAPAHSKAGIMCSILFPSLVSLLYNSHSELAFLIYQDQFP